MFPDVAATLPDTSPGLLQLRERLLSSSVPTAQLWYEALLEHWRERSAGPPDTLQNLFRLPEHEAIPFLRALGSRLFGVCAKDDELARKTMVEEVFALRTAIASLRDNTAAASRKTWRKLHKVTLASSASAFPSLHRILPAVICGYIAATSEERHKQFTLLMQIVDQPLPSDSSTTATMYSLIAPDVAFASACLRDVRVLMNPSFPHSEREGIEIKWRALVDGMKRWNIHTEFSYSADLLPYAVELDQDSQYLSVKVIEDPRQSLADFEHRLSTTSEFLEFMASTWNHVVLLPDFRQYVSFAPLLKATTCLLDTGSMSLDAVRVNADEPEEWDFQYPAAMDRVP
jgi:hypothetical protein